MTRFTIMEDHYDKMADMAHKQDFESSLVPTSLKIRLEDLAFLTALSKTVGESRNSIVSTILHDSLQEEIQSMSETDVKKIGELANEETILLFKKHLPDQEPTKHYLLKTSERIEEAWKNANPDPETEARQEMEEEKQELLREHKKDWG